LGTESGPALQGFGLKWWGVIGFLLLLLTFACIAIALVPDVVSESLTQIFGFAVVFSQVLFVLLGIAATIALVYQVWTGAERILSIRAERHKIEHEAQITAITAPADHHVIIHERSGLIRNVTFDARTAIGPGDNRPMTAEELQAWLLWHSLHATRHVGRNEIENLLEVPQGPVMLMPALQNIDRALIIGNSGAGKTTLLQHVISQRPGDVVVIDPHDDRHTWPPNAQIIGGGQDYDEIERALLALVEEIRRRYQERATGRSLDFGLLTVVVDEWRQITQNTHEAADSIKTVLTGGRKVRTACIVASHSERARPLGLEGEADLKDGFAIVRLQGSQELNIPFTATLDMGDGEIPVVLPGPYMTIEKPERLLIDPASVELPMTPQERQILMLWDAGHRSVTKIGAMVYGSKGGQQNELVRETLRKFKRV
jgi:hypothetical protein